MDIFSMLKNMDPDTLQKGIKQATEFLSTPEGQNAAKMISEGKMPDGGAIPDSLKNLADSVKNDEKARDALGEYLKKGLKTP
ncbi:MAG: hypothetical protein IKU60_02450 [Clostridia bacterium]|nr:hypothetical protein [Clostridia bacterium]